MNNEKLHFIYDYNGDIAGNPKGYQTHRGAMQQANSNRKLWRRYEERKDKEKLSPLEHQIMELLNKVCKALGISVLVLTVIGTVGILAFDALEFETTGSCTDCILLDKIRNLD